VSFACLENSPDIEPVSNKFILLRNTSDMWDDDCVLVSRF
jgi:hypothetical protein